MSDKCKKCAKVISLRKGGKIQCSDCKENFHGSCVDLSQQDIDFLVSENCVWRCLTCQTTRRKSLQVESTLGTGGTTNEDVMRFLKEMREEARLQMKALENDLGKSVEACHQRMEELINKVDEQSKKLIDYERKFEELRNENSILCSKVKSLENQLDDADQYSRVNCLEINGIPEEKHERVEEIIKKVGEVLEVKVSEEDIDACHRLGPVQEGRKRGIIVKFTRRSKKEELLKQRKIKRNFNTSDLGITSGPADVIYINESLTSTRRKLLNAARSLRQEGSYTYVWVRNGKIFVRKNEGDRAVVVTSLEQVAKLKAQ